MLDFISLDQISSLVKDLPETWWMAGILLGVFAVGGCLFFPTPVIAFTATLIFPIWVAIGISLVGAGLASATGYFLGRSVDPENLSKKYADKIRQARKTLDKKGVWAVLALRIAPTPPFTFTSMLSGNIKLPFLPYCAASIAGISPFLILVCILGERFLTFLKEPSALTATAVIALLILFFAFSSHIDLSKIFHGPRKKKALTKN